jgi:hypothetical protein
MFEYTIYPYITQFGVVYNQRDTTGYCILTSYVWVFDDILTDLTAEALVSGTDTLINYMVNESPFAIPDAQCGFKLTFSDKFFEGCQVVGNWFKTDIDDIGMNITGNWYNWNLVDQDIPNINGWLCPALFLYFKEAPNQLFAQVQPIM